MNTKAGNYFCRLQEGIVTLGSKFKDAIEEGVPFRDWVPGQIITVPSGVITLHLDWVNCDMFKLQGDVSLVITQSSVGTLIIPNLESLEIDNMSLVRNVICETLVFNENLVGCSIEAFEDKVSRDLSKKYKDIGTKVSKGKYNDGFYRCRDGKWDLTDEFNETLAFGTPIDGWSPGAPIPEPGVVTLFGRSNTFNSLFAHLLIDDSVGEMDISGWINAVSLRHMFTASEVQSIKLPKYVTCLAGCFSSCYNLAVAPVLPPMVRNLYRTFFDCVTLAEAPEIPTHSGLTSLGFTFDGCETIVVSPHIPDNITNLYRSFYGCSKLETVTNVPKSTTCVTLAFAGCNNLLNIPDDLPGDAEGISTCFRRSASSAI